MAKYGIGQAITRREDLRLLLGTGQYVDDMSLPGEVHAIFVRSPHAHARIVSIDTSAAKSAPGVVAVLTGADLKADGVGPLPIGPGLVRADGKPMDAAPNDPLAVDTVRYVGEAVVAFRVHCGLRSCLDMRFAAARFSAASVTSHALHAFRTAQRTKQNATIRTMAIQMRRRIIRLPVHKDRAVIPPSECR